MSPKRTKRRLKLPPSTREHLHISLQKLSQQFGPVTFLNLGSRSVVVISSPSAFKECFTKNDIVLANRPNSIFTRYITYYTNIVGVSYGDHWRNQRRLVTLELFSTARVSSFLNIRREEVNVLLLDLFNTCAHEFSSVEIKSNLKNLTYNILRMISGRRYQGDDVSNRDEAKTFMNLVTEIFKWGSLVAANDFIPFLQWIDYKNHEKKLSKAFREMDSFLQDLIDEHRGDKSKNTLVNQLFLLQESQPEHYTDYIIKSLVSAIILAGTDTSSVTLEWALSLLVNHPEVLKKAKAEIDSIVGNDKLVEESDLSN